MPRFETLWRGWRQGKLELQFPDAWQVASYSLPECEPLSAGQLGQIARSALDGLDLRALRSQGGPACLVVDDITRPCSWRELLPAILNRLNEAGWPDAEIRVLISLAGHAPMSAGEMEAKLGPEAVSRIRADCHSLDAEFRWFDWRTGRVGINRIFCDASLRLVLGSVLPHPFAGFSGGGKAIMPGIADRGSIRRNHGLLSFGKGRVADTDNEIRRQMDEIAALTEPHLAMQAVCDGQLRIVSLHAAPMPGSFASSLAFARRYCAASVRPGHNVVVLNCFPKDEELLQVTNAFNVLRTMSAEVFSSCKAVVLLGHAGKGLGFHAFFGPGGSLYRPPRPLGFLKGVPLIGFFPGATAEQYHQVFSPDSIFASSWQDAVARLEALDLGRYDVALFHQASLQTAG